MTSDERAKRIEEALLAIRAHAFGRVMVDGKVSASWLIEASCEALDTLPAPPRCPICKQPEALHAKVWSKGNELPECPAPPPAPSEECGECHHVHNPNYPECHTVIPAPEASSTGMAFRSCQCRSTGRATKGPSETPQGPMRCPRQQPSPVPPKSDVAPKKLLTICPNCDHEWTE